MPAAYSAKGTKSATRYKAIDHHGPTAAKTPATIAQAPTRRKLLKTNARGLPPAVSLLPVYAKIRTLNQPQKSPATAAATPMPTLPTDYCEAASSNRSAPYPPATAPATRPTATHQLAPVCRPIHQPTRRPASAPLANAVPAPSAAAAPFMPRGRFRRVSDNRPRAAGPAAMRRSARRHGRRRTDCARTPSVCTRPNRKASAPPRP